MHYSILKGGTILIYCSNLLGKVNSVSNTVVSSFSYSFTYKRHIKKANWNVGLAIS